MERKFQLVDLTFINEKGERITYNLETGKMTPEGLDDDSRMNALLRIGAFTASGQEGLKKLWGDT